MSQIDREMQQIGHRRGAPLSAVATLTAPLHGGLTVEPVAQAWWLRALRALEQVADTVWTWRDRARTRRHLAMLDDRLLRDIGITRFDARSEAAKPFWRV